jgi:hypothetical protein
MKEAEMGGVSGKVYIGGYDEQDQARIKALAVKLVSGMVEQGKIPETVEAIRAAMPDALRTARDTIGAVNEFLAG